MELLLSSQFRPTGGARSGHIHIPAQIFAAKLFWSLFNQKESLSQNETWWYPKEVSFDKSCLRSTLPRIPGVQTASFLSMSSWHFFCYLKSLTVEPLFNSEMVHSYFLLRGRLAFVWRQAHIAGWLSTVCERSVLAIRPYLYWLNQLSSLADAKGLPFFHPSFDIFIHISGGSFRENYRYKSSSGFAGRATIKISRIYRGC